MLSKRFALVSGGPGTGKTTLLVRALICLKIQNPNARIAIAAPTGKAAARIGESIAQQTSNPQEKIAPLVKLVQNLPVKTLHKLLGLGWNGATRYGNNKADADIVVVDEASMISQNLMATLLNRLAPGTKLILLGDKNQLESVEPGNVFGDLCAAKTLAHARVELTESRRFNDKNFLGKLAATVLKGENADVEKMLSGTLPENISASELGKKPQEKIRAALLRAIPKILQNVPENADPDALLAALATSRVLTPTLYGALGVEGLNETARKIFAPNALGEVFHGQPIMIRKNDDTLSLSNGDVGIVLLSRENEKEELKAWFPGADGKARAISTAFLPKFETAYAMTIHKSQGSEFSRLFILLPPVQNKGFYKRQLLYTALTRFKESPESSLEIIFANDALAECTANTTHSRSLLQQRINSLA